MSTNAPSPLHFYGHGKLLLTAEYFILDGARGLAIPTRFGQHLRVKNLSGKSNTLYWIALNHLKQAWLNLAFDKSDLSCINSETSEAKMLTRILRQARTLNPDFMQAEHDIAVETYLEFPNSWGLGSSSTLIYCVSQWAGVDGYTLLQQTMGGSGYDVACAGSAAPIVYHLVNGRPQWQDVSFIPPFHDKLWFVYTGQKQLSTKGIQYYKEQARRVNACIGWLDRLTDSMLQCSSLAKMEQIMREHENIISEELKLTKVKDVLFPDYWGEVKSLGAWGGDFVMLCNERPEEELLGYLHTKGMHIVHRYEMMVYK